MEIKTYGIFDTVAKTLRNTFTSENDETALRACAAIAKEPRADRATLKDCIVKYLYSINSSDGTIIDIQQRDIVAFATLLEGVEEKADDKSIAEIKEMYQALKQSYKSMGDSMAQVSKVNEFFVKRFEAIEKKIDDIIGGNIKCHKYKRQKMVK